MQLDPNPSFRRVIPPWYDADALCWAVLVLMLVVVLFALAGVSVALSHPAFSGRLWLPLLLAAMSFSVLASTALRLYRRRRRPE
jgi:lipopolysaccharide export LptBFGC system permease protein LptF